SVGGFQAAYRPEHTRTQRSINRRYRRRISQCRRPRRVAAAARVDARSNPILPADGGNRSDRSLRHADFRTQAPLESARRTSGCGRAKELKKSRKRAARERQERLEQALEEF